MSVSEEIIQVSRFDVQISSLINVHDWQKRSDEARCKDQRVLHDRLNELESNQSQVRELLSMSFQLLHLHLSAIYGLL